MKFTDDDKRMELESIEAIFPNSTKINYEDFTGVMQIPIQSDSRISVRLIHPDVNKNLKDSDIIMQESVKYLPPINFSFYLHDEYPYQRNLDFDLTSEILSTTMLAKIRNDLEKIWKEFKDQILYYLIDHLTQECQNELIEQLKIELAWCHDQAKFEKIISYNKVKEKEEFNMQTFDCEICLDNKKGLKSTQLSPCGHTFCNKCLYDFFYSSIISGDVDKIHCPNFECTKEITKNRKVDLSLESLAANPVEYKKKIFTLPISMDTMVLILESECEDQSQIENLLMRYQKLFIRNQFNKIKAIFPNKVVSCPRTGCDEQIFRENIDDELAVCPRCKYAFCVNCLKSWHGKYYRCKIDENDAYSGIPIASLEKWLRASKDSNDRRNLGYEYGSQLIKRMANLYMSDKLFKEMINDTKGDLTKCPNCAVVTQRFDGCNKMTCPFCQTYFCNLCGEELFRRDPYYHYRIPGESCYGKLFDGMAGVDELNLPNVDNHIAPNGELV